MSSFKMSPVRCQLTHCAQDFVEVDETDCHGDGLEEDGCEYDEPQTLQGDRDGHVPAARGGHPNKVQQREERGERREERVERREWRVERVEKRLPAGRTSQIKLYRISALERGRERERERGGGGGGGGRKPEQQFVGGAERRCGGLQQPQDVTVIRQK